MALNIIPLEEDEIRYDTNIVLDDIEFILFRDWNEEEQFWYLTLKYLDGTLVRGLIGVKVVVNWPLNRFVTDENFPLGILFAMNQTNTDPGLDDLKLVWCDADTWEGIQDGTIS